MSKTYRRTLADVIPNALLALMYGSTVVSFTVFIIAGIVESASFGRFLLALSDSLMASAIAIAIGILPVLLVASPFYALFVHSGRASYMSAFFVGLVLSAPLLLFSVGAGIVVVYACVIALATHWLCSRTKQHKAHA